MRNDATQTGMKVGAAVTAGFGLMLGLAAWPGTVGVIGLLTDLVFWPLDGRPSLTAPETRLYCAISGGVLTGWGVMLWQIATRLYPREPALARTMVQTGAVSWFVVDSLGSVLASCPGNVLLNVPFLVMFLWPFWWHSDQPALAKSGG
jgi:hypothetical protein